MNLRSEIYFPSLRFLKVKSVGKSKEFDARNTPYYWMSNKGKGIQAQYLDVYKIVSFCDFDFSLFPFETLYCNITFRSSQSSDSYVSLKKPELYFAYQNEEFDSVPIETNLPFQIWAKSLDPFLLKDGIYDYSTTGIDFTIRRNKLGLLISRFYGPMAIFSALAMLSYNINPDVVLIQIHIHICIRIHRILMIFFFTRFQEEWVW